MRSFSEKVIDASLASIRRTTLFVVTLLLGALAMACADVPTPQFVAVTTYIVDTGSVDPNATPSTVPAGPDHDSLLMADLLRRGAVKVSNSTINLADGGKGTIATDDHAGTSTAIDIADTVISPSQIQLSLTITRETPDRTSHISVSQSVSTGQVTEVFKDEQGPRENVVVFAKAMIMSGNTAPSTPAATTLPAPVNPLPDTLKVAWDDSTLAVPKPVDLPADFYQSMTYKAWKDVGGAATLSFDEPGGDKIVVTVRGYLDGSADPKAPMIVKVDDVRSDGSRRATTLYGTALDLPIQWSHLATDGSSLMDRVIVDTARDGTRYIQYVDIFSADGTGVRYEANQYSVAYMQWAIDGDGLIKRKLKGSTSLNVPPGQ